MFGYVMIDKPELKIKDFERYRSYYCGLCQALKRRHGLVGRAMLTYDMAFLEMVLSDLYDIGDGEEDVSTHRCIVHPLHRHCQRCSTVSDYCADMTILLAYQKCMDDWHDEKRLGRWIWSKLLRRKYNKVKALYPDRTAAIENRLHMLSIVENAKNTPLDKVAKLFGEIMADVFVWKDDFWKDDLYRTGFFLGKYIYLLDAYEDLEKDKKSGAYNPFLPLADGEGFEEQVLQLLTMMMGECTDAFERLPLVENVDIMRNILYSGVWVRYQAAHAKRHPDQAADTASGQASETATGHGPAERTDPATDQAADVAPDQATEQRAKGETGAATDQATAEAADPATWQRTNPSTDENEGGQG